MNTSTNNEQELIGAYFAAEGERADALLSEMVESVIDPTASRIIARRLHISRNLTGSDDAREIAGDVRVQMISTLQRMRADKSSDRIGTLAAYAATVTRNAVNEYLRRRFPERFRLSNQLRHLLMHGPEFFLYRNDEEGTVCGLARLKGRGTDPFDHELLVTRFADASRKPLRVVTANVFQAIGHPVTFDDLVALMATIRRIVEPSNVEIPAELPSNSNGADRIAKSYDRSEFLRAAWHEIKALPLRHRRALLLHFSDDADDNLLILFPLHGVASIRTIAETIEIDIDEFAAMWADLPLTDKHIAEMMDLERQQVVNLRQSARNMLKRRLAPFARDSKNNFSANFSSNK